MNRSQDHKKRITRKFLEVSRWSCAKQRQRNVQKKCAARAKLFFLLTRPTDFFLAVFVAREDSITLFSILFKLTTYISLTRASLLALAKSTYSVLWLVKIWQVSSCGKFIQHLETRLLIAEADRVLCHLVMVFYCLFPLDIQNETQVLPRIFCYSWLVCLLGFWFRNSPLVGNKISESIVFKNELTHSPCLMPR